MAQPPSPQAEPGATPDTLTEALRAGLPLICWHPSAGPDDLQELVDWLLGGEHGIDDLPERHREALIAATAAGRAEQPAYDLVVLWDDLNRVIDLDAPPIPNQFVGPACVAPTTLMEITTPVAVRRRWSG